MAKRLPLSHCLNCGKELDAASHYKSKRARPRPGNATVCLYCGHLMVLDKDMRLRAPTDAEVLELAGDIEYLRTQRFIALWRKIYPER